MQAALVLVFLEDVVQLVFELTHRMISQRWTHRRPAATSIPAKFFTR
jgi:hypothetical protein